MITIPTSRKRKGRTASERGTANDVGRARSASARGAAESAAARAPRPGYRSACAVHDGTESVGGSGRALRGHAFRYADSGHGDLRADGAGGRAVRSPPPKA